MQHAPYLFIPSDDRVELSAPRFLDEILGVLVERLISVFTVLGSHFFSFTQFVDGRCQFLFSDACVFQDSGDRTFHGQQSQKHRFERDELVAALGSVILCPCQHFVAFAAQVGFAPLHLWQRSDLAFQYLFDLPAVDAQFLKEEIRDVFPHLEDTGQQVLRFDGLLSPCLYKVDGFLNGLLGLDGKFVKSHGCFLSIFNCLFFCVSVWRFRATLILHQNVCHKE